MLVEGTRKIKSRPHILTHPPQFLQKTYDLQNINIIVHLVRQIAAP